MEIIKDLNSDRLERKLDNGLIETKVFRPNGQLEYHYFIDETGKYQGEYKWYWGNGQLGVHCFYKNDLRHDELKWYDKGGQLEEHKLYENNILIKNLLDN